MSTVPVIEIQRVFNKQDLILITLAIIIKASQQFFSLSYFFFFPKLRRRQVFIIDRFV